MDKKFLDKVIDQMVSETSIEGDKLYPPFSFFSLPNFYSLHSLFWYLGIFNSTFTSHCKDVYGIKDEQEVNYVLNKYRVIITDKINSKDNINESTGINKMFLDKVVDSLVSETIIEDDGSISTPFLPLSFSFLYSFTEHCREVYGLNEEETKYVWEKYSNILVLKQESKSNLNESTDLNTMFLDKVVDQISIETRIYIDNGNKVGFTTPPFIDKHPFDDWTTEYFKEQLKLYCRDVYGLNDEEIDYVWVMYNSFIKNGFKQSNYIERLFTLNDNINESTMDKRFLNKVIEQIVSETTLDFNLGEVTFFFPTYNYAPFDYFTTHIPNYWPKFNPFIKHCKEVYGLYDEEEIQYVWDMVKSIIKDKIKSKKNINESTGINKKFLDKVVDSIVDDTNMVDGRLLTPYYNESPIPTKDYIYSDRTDKFPTSKYVPQFFKLYCKDVFGLSDRGEREYVWNNYKTMVIDKIEHQWNI